MHPFVRALEEALQSRFREQGLSTALQCSDQGLSLSIDGAVEPFQVLLTPRSFGQKHFKRTAHFHLGYVTADAQLSGAQRRVVDSVTELVAALEQEPERALELESLPAYLAQLVPPPDEPEVLPLPDSSALTATIKLSARCNLDCTFCIEKPRLVSRSIERMGELRRLLHELADQGVTTISFDGGEAALSPLLPGAIEYARRVGFQRVAVVTNGVRFADGRFLERLRDAGLQVVNVSLHAADAETARAIYGTDPTPRQLQALGNIRSLTPELDLIVSTVLVEDNRASLSRILTLAAEFEPQQQNLIFCLLNTLRMISKRVRLASLDDGEVMRQVEGFLEQHPHRPLALRHFPFCKVDRRLWDRMQRRGKKPANSAWGALLVHDAPNRWLCPRCDERFDCYFPLLLYLVQRHPGVLATAGPWSLLGGESPGERFRRGWG